MYNTVHIHTRLPKHRIRDIAA